MRGWVLLVAFAVCAGACARSPAEVGRRAIVLDQDWRARACGTPFPYVVEEPTRAHEPYLVHCPAGGDRQAYEAVVPSFGDRLWCRFAWGFPGVVIFTLLLALLPLVAGFVPRLRDVFGVRRAEARLAELAGASPPAPVPALAPLTCPGCSADIALVDAAQVACAHCGAEVAIPEAYRAPGRLHAAAAQDLELATRAWRSFRIVRAGGTRVTLALLGALVVLQDLGAIYGFAPGMLGDYAVFLPGFLIGTGYLLVTLSRATLRLPRAPTLATALSTAPVELSGARCSLCGAALEIPPSAFLLASCRYCGTQHLLGQHAGRRAIVAAVRAEHAAADLLEATRALRAAVTVVTNRVLAACWIIVAGALALAFLASRCN
jgi:hypothetical protein